MSNSIRRRLHLAVALISATWVLFAAASASAFSLGPFRFPDPPAPKPPVVVPVLPALFTAVSNTVNEARPGTLFPKNSTQAGLGPSPIAVLLGSTGTTASPQYWANAWDNLVNNRTVIAPMPIDLIKPELFLPNVPVSHGTQNPWLMGSNPQDLRTTSYQYKGKTRTLADYMRDSATDDLVVLHNGKLVADYYANGYDVDTPHQPWSVTKSFVSALVGIARSEGKIGSLDAPIDQYIEQLRGTAWHGTTLRNLLTMQSGIQWDEGTPLLPQNTQVQEWIAAWLDYSSGGLLGQTRNEFLASLPRVAPQGTQFSYNSGNTQVLAWLLETIYGKQFNEIASEKLWKPMGMIDDASMITDRVGSVIASQGLYAHPYDFARFGELYRNHGRSPDGRQIVPEAWVNESTQFTSLSGGAYGYQWWANSTDPTGFSAVGFQGNMIAVSPRDCTVIVRLGHTLGVTVSSVSLNPFAIQAGIEMGSEFDPLEAAIQQKLGGCPAGTP